MSNSRVDIQRLFSLAGKVALVTGGSRGIGYMIAQGLLQAGARVYITSRKADACQDAVATLARHGDCKAIPADVSDSESRQQLCQQFETQEDRLHILVNNAGTAWGEDYEQYPVSAFDKLMRVNVASVFALTRDLTPQLEAAATAEDPARVINIGSMEGLHIPTVHGMGNYAYTASKAAVHHLTRHLAVELGPRSITVNAIAPGFFESKMTDYVFDNRRTEIEHNCPLRRVGKPEDMAAVAIYLSSLGGAYTNGAVIPVDGGTSINHQHMDVANASSGEV